MKRIWLTFLLSLLLSQSFGLSVSVVFAGTEAVGKVVALRGEVVAVDTAGVSRVLQMKSEVFLSDTVRTGRRGRVQMLFSDDTIISLGAATVMTIADYDWQPASRRGSMKTQVEEGTFRVLGGLITKHAPEQFVTETPAATIGIRGSMYAGSYRDSQLNVVFLGGRGIDVFNQEGQVALTTPGFGTLVEPGKRPAAGRQFTPDELQPLLERGADDSVQAEENPLVTVLIKKIILANYSDRLNSAAEDAISTFLGKYQRVVSEVNSSDYSLLVLNEGALVDGGLVIPKLSDGRSLPPFMIAPRDISASYLGYTFDGDTISFDAEVGTISYERNWVYDNKGEFYTSYSDYGPVTVGGVDYLFGYQDFNGIPSLSLNRPLDGIDVYSGQFFVVNSDKVNDYGEFSLFSMAVNWHSNTFLGSAEEDGPFFFGRISGPTLVNTHITQAGQMTGAEPPLDIVTTAGDMTFGRFFGSEYQAIGMTAVGADYAVYDQALPVSTWSALGAGFLESSLSPVGATMGETDPTLDFPTITLSPREQAHYTGYVTGLAEWMDDPFVDRRFFLNEAFGDFSLVLNRDAGTVVGSLSAMDVMSSDAIANLGIGGYDASAYIDDKLFIALVGCENHDCLVTEDGAVGVKPYGSFLVTAERREQFSDYLSWGFWDIAYTDPAAGDMEYDIHQPGSLWIAGERTPAATLDSLVDYETQLSAEYTGPAYGTHVSASGWVAKLSGGTTHLTVDFAEKRVGGEISFDLHAPLLLETASTTWIDGQFAVDIAGDVSARGAVGSFYGPAADAVGGNFYVDRSGEVFSGIFGGELVGDGLPSPPVNNLTIMQ